MKCLWLTLADPDPPTNGQFLYTGRLVRAVAAAGAEVHLAGLARPEARHHFGEEAEGIRWWLAEHRPRAAWRSGLSILPSQVYRTRTAELRRIVATLLRQSPDWDAIVIDSHTPGWAVFPILRRYARQGRRPVLAYLANNHEESVAWWLAAAEAHPLKRQWKRLEAAKATWLERQLVRAADLVTANTPEDCARFHAFSPGKPVEFLPPSYDGPAVGARRIGPELPRRVLILGSFDWSAKRRDLEAFLDAADELFAAAGIELQIVGSGDEAFFHRLRARTVATRFTGRVDDIAAPMAEARLALVVERFGGFKLKALDYVFNRLPIFGILGAVPGMPLRSPESIMLFPDHKQLAQGVVQAIDDFARLNAMQERAYAACQGQFIGAAIVSRLLAALTAAGPRCRQEISPPAVPAIIE